MSTRSSRPLRTVTGVVVTMATYRVMAKRCGFCDFAADDETAFAEHLRTVHRWAASGTAPTAVAAAPTAEQLAARRGTRRARSSVATAAWRSRERARPPLG